MGNYDLYGNHYRTATEAMNAEMAQCAEIDNRINSRRIDNLERQQQRQYERDEREYYEQMEHDHWEEMAKQSDVKFRFVCIVSDFIISLAEKVKAFKEKQYNKNCYKLSHKAL